MNTKKEVLAQIDEKRNTTAANGEYGFFEVTNIRLPKPAFLRCTHCKTKQKLQSLDLYSNNGVMGKKDLPTNDISIIAVCPKCGNRMTLTHKGVKDMMNAQGKMIRTLIILAALLIASIFVSVKTLRDMQAEKYFAQGNIAYEAADYTTAIETLTSARKYGSADAAYLLSLCYRNGTGVAVDISAADQLLQEAIENNSGRAEYAGAMYSFEQYIANGDTSELENCINALKESNAPDAMYQLSLLTRAGIGVPLDTDEADTILEKAVENGSVPALCDYAQRLIYNDEADKAQSLLKSCQNQDNPDIMAAEGYTSLFCGDGIGTGTGLLDRAVEKGSARGSYYWGLIYYNSLLTGESRDINKAMECFQTAVNHGSYRGKYELALCYAVQGDNETALRLAQDCYNRGYQEAAGTIGYIMQQTNTGSVDEIMSYVEKAREVQYAPADIWLANYYYYSVGDTDQACDALVDAYYHGARWEANVARDNMGLSVELGPSTVQ